MGEIFLSFLFFFSILSVVGNLIGRRQDAYLVHWFAAGTAFHTIEKFLNYGVLTVHDAALGH